MHKLRLLSCVIPLVVGVLAPTSIFGQPYTWTEANGVISNPVTAVGYDLAGVIYFGSTQGYLFRSPDTAVSWSRIKGPSASTITTFLFTTDTTGFCGTGTGLWRSTNRGMDWAVVSTGIASRSIRSLCAKSPALLFAATTVGPYRSTDGGDSWARVVAGMSNTVSSSIAVSSGGSVLVATNGGVYRSTDDGGSWVLSDTGWSSTKAYSVSVTSGGVISAGADSCIYVSGNDGASWVRRDLPVGGSVAQLVMRSAALIYAGTGSQGIYATSDTGHTWVSISGGLPDLALSALTFIPPATLMAGVAGGLFRTADGVSWESMREGLRGTSPLALTTDGLGVLWTGANGKGLFRSTDDGVSWQRYCQVPPSDEVHCISFSISSGLGWAGTGGEGILRTTDFGGSWTPVTAGLPTQPVMSILQLTGDIILAGTTTGLFRSRDAGLSWSATNSATTVRGFALPSQAKVFAGTSNGILASMDSGLTWVASGLAGIAVTALCASPGGVLWAGTSGTIYMSTDNGTSWTSVFSNSSQPTYAIISPIEPFVAAATASGVWASTNDGATWTDAGLGAAGLCLAWGLDYSLLTGRSGGGVWRTTTPILEHLSLQRWMSIGSLQNWFSATGCEIDEGFVQEQQFGLSWPTIRPHQDMQVAKGLWIGTTNYTGLDGKFYPYKVVHIGPRVMGSGEFIPVILETKNRFEPPFVTVSGAPSYLRPVENDAVDPVMIADRSIVNRANTSIGVTMERTILGFSQEFHDDYIVSDYLFTNNSGKTLTGVYFYFLYRLAICAEACLPIGNSTRWGINTMLDARGDGVKPDPPGEQMRAQYAWHGLYPSFAQSHPYDNLGGPIVQPYYDMSDTVGRLGAAQFAGILTLHADTSPTDPTNDPAQPSTTSWEGSDEPFTFANSQYDAPTMEGEYTQWMTRGHKSPRHADRVEPTGDFASPTYDPALGTPGGWSASNGYGPYKIAAGEKVHLVIAEAAAGLSFEECVRIGRQLRSGQITNTQKNIWVLTGKDSLFQTFRRAQASYASGYAIPQPPKPPKEFHVEYGSNGIKLTWDVYDPTDPTLKGFEVYRASGRPDGSYALIGTFSPAARNHIDSVAIARGISYFYYVLSVGDSLDNDGSGLTPRGALKSSRYYTQTYDPAFLTDIDDDTTPMVFALYQNYPNPFNPATDISFRIAHSGHVSLTVYDLLGRQVARLVDEVRPPGAYTARFDGRRFASGVYIYRMETPGFTSIKKMVMMK